MTGKPSWQEYTEKTAAVVQGLNPLALWPTVIKGDLVFVADAFDAIVKQNNQYLDAAQNELLEETRRKHGKGFTYYNIAVSAEVASLVAKGFQAMGAGLTDTLRLGESLRDPSAGAVFRDGLRVLNIIPPSAIGKIAMIPRLVRARLIPGGLATCNHTSTAAGTVLSSNKGWFKGVLAHFDDVVNAMKKAGAKAGPIYAAGKHPQTRLAALKSLGVKAEYLAQHTSLRDLVKQAAMKDGAIIFDFQWETIRNGVKASDWHSMVMFRDLGGEVMLLDQYGVWSIRWLEKGAFELLNVAPTRIGREIGMLKVPSQVIRMYSKFAVQLEMTTMLPEIVRLAQAARANPGSREAPALKSPLSALVLPFVELSPDAALVLDLMARKAAGRKLPVPAAPASARPAAPGTTPMLKSRDGLTPLPGGASERGLITEGQWLYTVRHGDTLIGLAQRFYGDGALAREIQQANGMGGFLPHVPLRSGSQLKIIGFAR